MAEKREVNFEETIHLPEGAADEADEPEDAEETPEETETPAESSQQETEPEAEEESEESEAETEEETPEEGAEEESEEPAATEAAPVVVKTAKEPKPVEGETPREKALRLETQRLRGLLKTERGNKMFGNEKVESQVQLAKEDEEILKQYDQTEVENLEKLVDVIAKKKGWVRKDEVQTNSYQQQASDVLDGFLESHPEYLPENDKDNLLWNRFQQEFSLYKRPTNPRDLKRVFDKVHAEVFGFSKGADATKINAAKEKVKVASHGGKAPGGPKTQQTAKPAVDASLGEHLKGFTDEEKKEILGA